MTGATPPAPATYTPKIGIAVNPGDRTCMAIQNPNIATGSPVTLVSAMPPETFTQAEVTGPAKTACPITKEVDPTVSSYELRVPQGPPQKLTPMIAVLGPSGPFSMGPNNNVQADLDQNGKTETFRTCSSNNGIHLTVWFGNPLDGTLLWHGYYYEPSNPGIGPACTAKETANP